MRRGESRAKGPKRGARKATGASKAKTRPRHKASVDAPAKKRAAQTRQLNKTAKPEALANRDESNAALRRSLADAYRREARLSDEVQARTKELTEAMEQQTATSEVLGVISSSPGELQPVFEAMLANATRLCEARFGALSLYDGEEFRNVATHNVPLAFAEVRKREPFRPAPGSAHARVVVTKEVIHLADAREDPAFLARDPAVVAAVELGGARTAVVVPMLKENELIGAMTIFRQEVRPFTDKQIDLVKSFAKQAVIAIENARLLTELRESLEQQTATSEVLQVISSSPGELEPVFNTILENATRICESQFGDLLLSDGEAFRTEAFHNVPSAYSEQVRGNAFVPAPGAPMDRLKRTKQPVHVVDLRLEAAYIAGSKPINTIADSGGARSIIIVPMLKESTLTRSNRHLPPRSAAVRRQTDRTRLQLYQAGCYRDRKHAIAQ